MQAETFLKDKEFLTFIVKMGEEAKKVANIKKVFHKVQALVNREAGPANSEFPKFGHMLFSLYSDKRLFDLAFLRKLDLDAIDFFERYVPMWNKASQEEKDSVIEIINKAIKETEEEQKKQQIEKRKEFPPEAPEGDEFRPLDDYAFSYERKRNRPPEEDNNKLEDDLYNELLKHFDQNSPISEENADLIVKIMKKGFYKQVFHEPEQDWIFRGMGVTTSWLKNFIGIKEHEELPDNASRSGNFTFSPKLGQGSTSWSSSRSAALDFGEDNDHKVLMIASTKKNPFKFATARGGFYDVAGFDKYESEDEVIGLGPINVSRIYWRKAFDLDTNIEPKTPDEE